MTDLVVLNENVFIAVIFVAVAIGFVAGLISAYTVWKWISNEPGSVIIQRGLK